MVVSGRSTKEQFAVGINSSSTVVLYGLCIVQKVRRLVFCHNKISWHNKVLGMAVGKVKHKLEVQDNMSAQVQDSTQVLVEDSTQVLVQDSKLALELGSKLEPGSKLELGNRLSFVCSA